MGMCMRPNMELTMVTAVPMAVRMLNAVGITDTPSAPINDNSVTGPPLPYSDTRVVRTSGSNRNILP